MHSCYRHLFK